MFIKDSKMNNLKHANLYSDVPIHGIQKPGLKSQWRCMFSHQ